jgi:RNA polymerase sigma-70 factor (ECF subfamily)
MHAVVLDYPLRLAEPARVSVWGPAGMTPRPVVDLGVDPEADPDAPLMAAFGRGDAGGFDTLYARHKGGVYRYFLRSLREVGLAEELAQDVWTSVIRAHAQWQPDASFKTWLYRLAHNRLIDHYRRANLVVFNALEAQDADDDAAATTAEHASAAPGPEEAAAQRIAARRVVHLVEALPPAQREALLLQLEGGLSLEEIAAATNQGFETVKSRLRYALAKVRDGMKGYL